MRSMFTARIAAPGPRFGWRIYSLLPVLVLIAAHSSRAADLGAVRGIVHDSEHRPIGGAEVALRSASSDWQQTTETSADGVFVLPNVPFGDYRLEIHQSGFASSAQPITVGSGILSNLHVQLSATTGSELAAVTVTATSETPEHSATPMTLVDRNDVQMTPGADRSNSLALITDFVPGAYFVHDQLHVRGGHQTTWAVDGVEIPNTNIASNLGPQIDPKDIDYLEIQRGSYEADLGDRTYGVFNVVPRTGFEGEDRGEVIASGGSYGQTNDYVSFGSHTDSLAYYASLNGNRSNLGIETPTAQILHDREEGYGGFGTLIDNLSAEDQIRLVLQARHDDYQIPNSPADLLDDTQRESDAFAILTWVHSFSADATLSSSVFYHYNRADFDGAPTDFPLSTTDQRASSYLGAQESLRWHLSKNELQIGLLGFGQEDNELFRVLFNDAGNSNDAGNGPVFALAHPSGTLLAAFIQDTLKATDWLSLMLGVRETYFSGHVTESATSPRIGLTLRVPKLGWIAHGFWGKFYQAPPLDTLSGPLLQFASGNDTAFLPLRGERDTEYQYGLSIPWHGWSIDVDRFRTEARNFFDHNPIGNSDIFLPLTITGALIQATELAVRSPRFWNGAQFHLAYSNQSADGFGAITGGLTDFSPATGPFALDHDQRTTISSGFDVKLPWKTFLSMNVSYGSGFANGDEGPSHLPSHAELDVSLGHEFLPNLTASVTALNLANKHLLIDNSLTFGGVHYNQPLQVYAEIRYGFQLLQ
jgi:hypothetical protein